MNIHTFDSFPEPVFLVSAILTIRYSNPAALSLLPDCLPGTPCPPQLSSLPDANGVFSCQLHGRQFQVSCCEEGEDTLLILRPARVIPEQAFSPTLLAAQVRENVQQLSFAAYLLSKNANLNEQERRHLAVIQQSLYRQLRLTHHLEQAQALADGEPPLFTPTAVDLAQICRDISYGVAPLAKQLGVCFQSNVPGGVVISTGEKNMLEQMLLELISNALRAAGLGGRAGLKLAVAGTTALITVWDNGPGMKADELAGLLGVQALQHPPQPGTGLGLGLALARNIAQLHGGSLLMESPQSQGMHVTVSLPIRRPSKSTLNSPCERPHNGYSGLLLGLADVLPWQCFQEEL